MRMRGALQKTLTGILTGGCSVVVKTAINIFLIPVIIAHLGLSQFSLYVLLVSVYELSTLLDMGAGSALVTLLSREDNESSRRQQMLQAGHVWFIVVALLMVGIGLVLTSGFTTWFNIAPDLASIVNLALFWVILESVVALYGFYYQSCLLSNLGHQWSNIAETAYYLGANAGSLVAVIFGYGLAEIFFIRFCFSVMKLLFVMRHAYQSEKEQNTLSGLDAALAKDSQATGASKKSEKPLYLILLPFQKQACQALFSPLKALAKLSSHALMINFSIIVSHKIDNFVIATFLPLQAVGIYEIVFRFLGIIIQMALKCNEGLFPIFAGLAPLNQRAEATLIFKRMSSFLLCVAGSLILLIAINYDTLFGLFSANKISIEQTYMLLAIAIPTVFSGVSQMPANAWLFTWGFQRYLTVSSLVAAGANLIISLALVIPLGIVGVALGTLIPQLIQHQFSLIATVCRKLQISLGDYLKSVYGAILLPMAVCYLWAQLWHPHIVASQYPLAMITLVSAIGFFLALLTWLKLTVTPDEMTQIKRFWRKRAVQPV
ncbi:MAG: polysaccharide biosynthesis C-terminal domain-containing protein [Cyanobacteria bacterium P01_H01_bin.74]